MLRGDFSKPIRAFHKIVYLSALNQRCFASGVSIRTFDPDISLPVISRSESYTLVPSESCRQVSFAIATASPVSILTRTPRSPASAIVWAVSGRGGSNLRVCQPGGGTEQENKRKSHWEKAKTFPVTIILLASYAWRAVKPVFRWTPGEPQGRLTERAETASGKFLYCMFVQLLDFRRWVCQAKNSEGKV